MALSDERTLCPHCGLMSRTAADGVCVECWEDKSTRSVYAPGKKPLPDPPTPRSSGSGGGILGQLLDDLIDWP